ncbi:MAG: class I SAM-dependent methyltransferase [Methylococcaceae bacterium]
MNKAYLEKIITEIEQISPDYWADLFAVICDFKQSHQIPTPLFQVAKVANYEDFKARADRRKQNYLDFTAFETNLLPKTPIDFNVNGFCYVCQKPVDFLVDFKFSRPINDIATPNWRERLVCPSCRLNNRMRATIHIFEQECQARRNTSIYLTEQTTTLYKWFKQNYSDVYGSEYLGTSIAYGSYNGKGIRNEDITKLSFNDASFDYILSFDVFEHIPDYQAALLQCLRCLKPKGQLLFSVPFIKSAEQTLVRAYIDKNGVLQHLLKPEYHGDPINAEGCLCFYHFGWDIIKVLNEIGFIEVNALLYHSIDYAYLGGEQIIFSATKPD